MLCFYGGSICTSGRHLFFVCSFSTTSVKILGLLPLFAAAIAKLIFRSFSTFFPVVVAVEDNGKGIVFSLFVYAASPTAPYPLCSGLIMKAAAVFPSSWDDSDELQ